MLIKTKEFKEVAANIAVAVNDNAGNLELVVKDGNLRLNVTNKEYYVSKVFPLENPEDFRAVVDAKLFLDLVACISSETFEVKTKDNTVVIKSGKSNYKLPMIYENDIFAEIKPIIIGNVTANMKISKDILYSILNVNSVEVKKASVDANELQKLYYVDETGCFTFTTGACLNKFELEKPIKMLLNDRVVKLFKLFKEDVTFFYGVDALADGAAQTKVAFTTPDTYVSAIINCDDVLLNKIQGPCTVTKNFINTVYSNKLVLSANDLAEAIGRLTMFTKNSISGQNMKSVPATVTLTEDELTITDSLENSEVVAIEAGSVVDTSYSFIINIVDLKSVLDACKNEHITLNCGNHKSVIITHSSGKIFNLIPESIKR